MLTNEPDHLKHFDYTGFHGYFLTFCTHQRKALFTCKDVVDLALSQISRAATDCEFAVIAYCFMSDHVHLLVHGQSESSDCKRFITLAKQYSGYYHSKQFGGRLWQRYGYQRTLKRRRHARLRKIRSGQPIARHIGFRCAGISIPGFARLLLGRFVAFGAADVTVRLKRRTLRSALR